MLIFDYFIDAEDVFLLQLITDESIIAVSENCFGLQYLCVSRCSRLTDAALVALGQTCTELQYVYSHSSLLLVFIERIHDNKLEIYRITQLLCLIGNKMHGFLLDCSFSSLMSLVG